MAFKYKIQILGGSSVINTVNAGDLNNPVSTATFNTKDLSAAVVGGNIDITNLATNKVVLSNIPHTDILNYADGAFGGSASQVATNLNLEFKVSAHTIGEIQGVTITGTPDNTYQGKGLVFDAAGKLVVSSSTLLNASYSPPPQVETDPVFTASPAYSITNTNKSNWNTAYSWGDHSTAGYITAASETLATITGRGASTTTTSIVPFNYPNQAAFPSSSTYKGAVAYSDTDKAMFVATGTNWLRIANQTEVFDRRYTSLTNVPTSFTPSAHTQAWSTITSTPTTIAGYGITDAFDGDYNSLSNLPTLLQLGTTSTTALAGNTTTITTTQANAIVTNTAKVSFPGFGTTAGTALEGNTALFDGNYASLSNIPSTFTPSAHTHTASEISDFDTEVSNNTSVAANTAKVGYTDAAVDLRIAAASIEDLSDVPTLGTAGQVLAVNAGATALEYVAQTGGGAVSIDDLTDVDTSTVAPSTGQALVWDGSQWEPGTVSGGGSSPWTTSGSDIYYTTGNVGVGTTTPAKALDVVGEANIKDANNNVFISRDSLATVTGTYNVGIGPNSLEDLTSGGQNVGIGYFAGANITSSPNNISIGYASNSGVTSQFQGNNIAIGGRANNSGNTAFNISIGGESQRYNQGSYNIAIGQETLKQTNGQSSHQNVAIGYQAFLASSSTKQQSTAVGYYALRSGANNSVAVGHQALVNNTGENNTFIGHSAGLGVSGTSTAGNTVAVGYQALTSLTTGTGNTAVGYQAGVGITNGAGNTLIGTSAGSDLQGGSNNNTLIGSNAGLGITNGVNNVFVGRRHTGLNSSYRVSLGYSTGASSYSVVIGDSAAESSSWAQGVTAIGYRALTSLTSGANSVAIGYLAGAAVTTGGNNVLIGYQAGSTLTTESNKLYIENSNSTAPLIYGEFDNDILRVNGTLQVNDPSSTGYAFPAATGTLGQVLEVDANGDLVFATPSGGGSSQWTTVNTNEIYYNSGNVGIGNTDPNAALDVDGDVDIELDSTASETFTIHDGTHDLFQVDTSTTGVLFSVNDVSGLPKLEVDEDEGVIAKSIKVDDGALTAAGQYGKGAEIWYQGTSTPTAGSIYYLNSSGNWANTDANAVATAKGMLSVSAGTDSDVDGMVIKGFVYVGTDPGGSVGDVVYLSETANQLTTTAPTTASAVVRVCGYKVGTNIVYFDPSKDWIELS